jgi:hypothetical protein
MYDKHEVNVNREGKGIRKCRKFLHVWHRKMKVKEK